MIQQLGREKTPDIVEVKSEVDKINKMVMELYDRLIIPELVITQVVPEVYIDNIWAIPDLVEVTLEERKLKNKRKHWSCTKKEAMNKAK